jgi:subtilisin family serine protease
MVPNDYFYNQYQYDMKPAATNTENAWDRTLGTTATKIAVVDTGIRRTHEDFAGGRVLQGFDFRNNDNDPQDQGGQCSYHGSHTAGTAAATINNGKGVAGVSQSQILPVKIFGGGACNTSNSAIINGLKYAGDQGAHVSSNSWGGGGSSTAINDAITYSHNKGTIHVAAAGNSGSCTNCVGQPWKDMGSISIVVSCSKAANAWCSYSSQGPQVDLIAPGDSIASVYGGSDTQYSLKSGTSMSCPHVAGAAALLKTLHPTWTFANVEGQLKSTALNLGFVSDRQGSGLLQGTGIV